MPTVNSVGAFAAAGPATALTVNPGASHAADDIDIVIYESADTDVTLTTAAGFVELTAVSPQSILTLTRLTVYWRRWNGTDGSPVTDALNNHKYGRMISVSGVKTTGDPWNITGVGTNETIPDTSISIVGGTTTVDDCLVILMHVQDVPDSNSSAEFSGHSNGDLANLTERMDNTSSQGNGGGLGMVTGEKASSGAFGATSVTGATSASHACAMIALEGASAAGFVRPTIIVAPPQALHQAANW